MRDLLGALASGEVNEHRFVPHNSPRIVLAASKSVKMVPEFIEAGSKANLADYKGTTAVMVAARRGDTAMIRYLIDQGADVNAKSVDMRTALMFACESGHFDIVKLLLSSGAEMYAADNRGVTVLMVSSAFPNLARTISMLVNAGAPVDSTALRHAAWRGDVDCVTALIAAGADGTDATPLFPACKRKCIQSIAQYLCYVAGMPHPDKDLPMTAQEVYHSQRASRSKVVEALIEAGAAPSQLVTCHGRAQAVRRIVLGDGWRQSSGISRNFRIQAKIYFFRQNSCNCYSTL